MSNKLVVLGILLVLLATCVSAEQSYVEALQSLKTQMSDSEKNIRDDINSFNGAFKDTFRLVDDEVSRLIIANSAMVGIVFAIMFLVYAKTTSRTKRDLQILLAAHAKHIDTVVSKRLDEFENRMVNNLRSRDPATQSKLGSNFDDVVGSLVDTDENFKRRSKLSGDVVPILLEDDIVEHNTQISEEKKTNGKLERSLAVATSRAVEKISAVEEAKLDKDGKVKVLKDSTSPLNKMRKRLKRGLLRLFGRNKPKEKIQEFKK
jgi:hypothetical protein